VALPHSRRFFSTDKTYDISSVIEEMNKVKVLSPSVLGFS
jgi:hypothetical protein